jgi:glycosyltransferase involved in cell wall biosynthesis
MTAMDVIVTPSLTESFGLTIAEAMAAGRPVVASEVGGVAEIVDEGLTGFLVPPNDPESLARRIIDVLSDAQRAAAMGAAGRQKAAQWNPARVAELTEAVYHRAMGAGRDR